MQRLIDGALIDFSAAPTIRGVMLQQFQIWREGVYRLNGTTISVDQTDQFHLYWSVSRLDGRELGRVNALNSATMQAASSGELAVTRRCAVQMSSFNIRSSDRMQGVSGRIERIALMLGVR